MSPEWADVARKGRAVQAIEIAQAPLEVDPVSGLGQIGVPGLGFGADSESPAKATDGGVQVQAGEL